jgi:hypothetical protein
MEGIPKARREKNRTTETEPEALLGGKFERGQEITVQLNYIDSETLERPFRYVASTIDGSQLCYVTTEENLGSSVDKKATVKITGFDDAVGAFTAELISVEQSNLEIGSKVDNVTLTYAGETGYETVYIGKDTQGNTFYVSALKDNLEGTTVSVTVGSNNLGDRSYYADAIVTGAETIPQKPKSPELQTFEKGQIVRGVTLTRDNNGKYKSSMRGRKAFLVSGNSLQTYLDETGLFRLPNDEFTVRVVRPDSNPNDKKGVTVVELLGTDSEIAEDGTLRTLRLPRSLRPSPPSRIEDNPFAALLDLQRNKKE